MKKHYLYNHKIKTKNNTMTKQELELRNLEAEIADRENQLTANYIKTKTIFNNSRIISRRGVKNIAVDLPTEFSYDGQIMRLPSTPHDEASIYKVYKSKRIN